MSEASIYREGTVLRLKVDQAFDTGLELLSRGRDTIAVYISKVYSPTTMAVVMEVIIPPCEPGASARTAVLKLYDMRFGTEFRAMYRSCYSPAVYSEESEAAWQEYVRQGKGKALFECLAERELERKEGLRVSKLSDSDSESEPEDNNCGASFPGIRSGTSTRKQKAVKSAEEEREKLAKAEGKLQHQALEDWSTEVKPYNRLASLQGKYLPKLFAQVRIATLLDDENEEYFVIGGILLQHIDGFDMDTLTTSGVPQQHWQDIVQRGIDSTNVINDDGVLNLACRPKNVVMERATLRPFFIDFAYSTFHDEVGSGTLGR